MVPSPIYASKGWMRSLDFTCQSSHRSGVRKAQVGSWDHSWQIKPQPLLWGNSEGHVEKFSLYSIPEQWGKGLPIPAQRQLTGQPRPWPVPNSNTSHTSHMASVDARQWVLTGTPNLPKESISAEAQWVEPELYPHPAISPLRCPKYQKRSQVENLNFYLYLRVRRWPLPSPAGIISEEACYDSGFK